MSREQLITKKELVRRQIQQTQRELEKARLRGSQGAKQATQLERKIEQLMAEESTLRQEIDKTAKEAEGIEN